MGYTKWRVACISEMFYLGGFVYTKDLNGNYIWHARMDCLQQYGGYRDFYDIVFDYATSMDSAKFAFKGSDGVDYMLWAWKGDYLNLGAGAEMGIYKRLEVLGNKTEHYLVDQKLSMHMTLTLKYHGETIINWDPAKDKNYKDDKVWWVTGFNPNYTEVKASELIAIYTVTFNTEQMYNDFKKAWKDSPRWCFNEETKTATFVF